MSLLLRSDTMSDLFFSYIRGEIYKVTVFPSYNGKTTSANVSVYSYSSAYNLINAINYCEVDGYTLYANICGYDSIRIQKEDLYSIFISQGHFSSERELFESCLVFGQVFRVKLLLGCAIVQFYNEESMNKALSARHIRGGKISKKTPRKVSNSKKIDKNDTPIKSDPVLLSEKPNKSKLEIDEKRIEIRPQNSSSSL